MKINKEETNIDSIFPGQRANEEVELIIRKHKIVLLPQAITLSFFIIVPWIFFILVAPEMMPLLTQYPYKQGFFLAVILFYGALWIASFMIWADYYLDIWILTNQRILDIEQKGFFHREVSELDLRRVQDISSSVSGFLPTFFGFGNVQIQTAAEMNKFTMDFIPHPVTARRKITEMTKKAQGEEI